MRIVDYLQQHALTQPEKVFIYQQAGKEQISYADFWKMVLQKAETLQGQGWQRGEVYCVRVSPTAGYLSLYFACQYLGVVIAPLENDLPADKLAAIEDRVRGIHLPEEASDILFTTGTTGAAKGVVLSGKSLVADAVNLTGALGFHSDIIFL
ncbi:MAG: acyl--CoA ligase, partial [Bacteroidales bacterium]|nr:acyl--CoA ligase [Bacteroidales bacterium]